MSNQEMEIEGKEPWQQYYVMGLTGVKVLSILAAITYGIAKKNDWSTANDIEKIKNTIKSLFNILLGGLLVVYFHPWTDPTVCIEGKVKTFIFTTSILLVLNSINNLLNP